MHKHLESSSNNSKDQCCINAVLLSPWLSCSSRVTARHLSVLQSAAGHRGRTTSETLCCELGHPASRSVISPPSLPTFLCLNGSLSHLNDLACHPPPSPSYRQSPDSTHNYLESVLGLWMGREHVSHCCTYFNRFYVTIFLFLKVGRVTQTGVMGETVQKITI